MQESRAAGRGTGSTRAVLAGLFLLAGALGAACSGEAQPARAQPSSARPPTVVITGANRGLGLEFARQFQAAGATVIGTARRPEEADELRALGVRIEALDVTRSADVAALAARLADEPVDILINNAGIGGRGPLREGVAESDIPEKTAPTLEQLDVDALDSFLQVNTLGPMRVTQALLPALRRGERKLVVNITSRMASLSSNRRGGGYGYRESKAALNMFTRSLAIELEDEGFTCVVLSPGWVRTSMGGPGAELSPEESIGGMLAVIERLAPADTGKFFSHDGSELPW